MLIRSPRDLPLDERYQLSDVQRGRSLAGLALLFAVVVVASGGCVGCSRLLVSG